MHVRRKPRKNEKAPYSSNVGVFFVYFDSKRIRGASLKDNVNYMKSSWIEFQSLPPNERKQWKDRYGLNRLHHNRQNPTVTRDGYIKKPPFELPPTLSSTTDSSEFVFALQCRDEVWLGQTY